jgi:L-xylulokinase
MHIEDLDKGIGVKMVRLTGGASRSSIWTQIFSDILNRRIEIVDKEETGCFGAAFYGAIASGKFKSVEEMQDLIHIKSEYEPKQEYDKKYEIYKESCNALTDIWNKLENI